MTFRGLGGGWDGGSERAIVESMGEAPVVLDADWIIPVTGPPIRGGHVVIEDGVIRTVAEGTPPPGSDVRLHPGAAIVPGLVSAHTHLACGFLKHAAEADSFPDWLFHGIGPRVRDAHRDDPGVFVGSARRSVRELLQSGVTLVADVFVDSAGLRVLEEARLPGMFFQEFFGFSVPDPGEYIARALRTFDETLGEAPPHRVGLSIHSPYLCPATVAEAVADAAKAQGRRLSIHLAESEDEHLLFTARRGRFHAEFERRGLLPRFRLDGTPTEAMAAAGALREGTLLAHVVHPTDGDLDLIARSGATVVHCPASNLRLRNGIAPVASMVERGIPVALGVDSAASNGKLDLIEEMRLAVLLSRGSPGRRPLDPATVLRMATLEGARALGHADVTGSIEPGKRADLAIVDLGRDRHVPFEDPVAALVLSAIADDVLETWVGGRRVFARRS